MLLGSLLTCKRSFTFSHQEPYVLLNHGEMQTPVGTEGTSHTYSSRLPGSVSLGTRARMSVHLFLFYLTLIGLQDVITLSLYPMQVPDSITRGLLRGLSGIPRQQAPRVGN